MMRLVTVWYHCLCGVAVSQTSISGSQELLTWRRGMERSVSLPLFFALVLAVVGCGDGRPKPEGMPDGFTQIFNGRDLTGWHKSLTNHHGDTDWVVEDGVLIGRQNRPGNGGIILTDASYKNFELYLEAKSTYGCDGGIFLRSTEDGKAYQILNDHRPGGNIGGIYLEGLGGTAAPAQMYEDTPELVWNRDDWNSVRATVTGQPPHIVVWLNGIQVTDWTGDAVITNESGMIAVQVHRGNEIWTVPDGFHAYRNIAIKQLPD